MSSSAQLMSSKFDVEEDRSFWVNAKLTERRISKSIGGDPVEGSHFITSGNTNHVQYVRLDENTYISPVVLDPNGDVLPPPDCDDMAQWTRINMIPWQTNPCELRPGDYSHPVRSDPGRMTECGGLIPTGLSSATPAIPTHHFATPWMLQKSAFQPIKSITDMLDRTIVSKHNDIPLIPPTICTGPFVCRLEPDPHANACMKLMVTVEYEAGIDIVENVGSTSVRYSSAGNGAVFLANEGHPWAIYDVTSMTVVMHSSSGGDRNKSDRFVHLSRGVLSLVYVGDREGIVKNFSSRDDVKPIPRGNLTNQYGYGSVGLGAPRTFTVNWDTTAITPVEYARSMSLDSVVNNFLRLTSEDGTKNLTGLRVYAKYSNPTSDLASYIEAFGCPPPINLDLMKIEMTARKQISPFEGFIAKFDIGPVKPENGGVPVIAKPLPPNRLVGPGSTVVFYGNNFYASSEDKCQGTTGAVPACDVYYYTNGSEPQLLKTKTQIFMTQTLIAFQIPDGIMDEKTLFMIGEPESGIAAGQTPVMIMPLIYPAPRVDPAHLLPVIICLDRNCIEITTGTTVDIYGCNFTQRNLETYLSNIGVAASVQITNNSLQLGIGHIARLTFLSTVKPTSGTGSDGKPIKFNQDSLKLPDVKLSIVKTDFVPGHSITSIKPVDSKDNPIPCGYYYTGQIMKIEGEGLVDGMKVTYTSYSTVTGVTVEQSVSGSTDINKIDTLSSFGSSKYVDSTFKNVTQAPSQTSQAPSGPTTLYARIPVGLTPGFCTVSVSSNTQVAMSTKPLSNETAMAKYIVSKPFFCEYGTSLSDMTVNDVKLIGSNAVGTGDTSDKDSVAYYYSQNTDPKVNKEPIDAVQVTYYIAQDTDIDLGKGDVTKVKPRGVISIYINRTDKNNKKATASITCGNIWLPNNTGVINVDLSPVMVDFPGYTDLIPNFPENGVPANSGISTETVASFPLGYYGSRIDTAKLGNVGIVVGAKYIMHDFDGTSVSNVFTNFRVRKQDIVTPKITTQGSKELLTWEPLFGKDITPDVVTITRPNGFNIEKYKTTPDQKYLNRFSLTYTRSIKVEDAMIDPPYKHCYSPNADQLAAKKNGDPIISVQDSVNIITSLNREFCEDTTSSPTDGSGVGTNATNDCLLWRGYSIVPCETDKFKNRIRTRPLEWGRRIYRYARYIEMATKGEAPPFAPGSFVDPTTNNDNSPLVIAVVTDAAIKLWLGVRAALTYGFVPEWEVLSEIIREHSGNNECKPVTNPTGKFSGPGQVSVNISDSVMWAPTKAPIVGMDVIYNGSDTEILTRSMDDPDGLSRMLNGAGFTNVKAKVSRINKFTFDGLALSTTNANACTTIYNLSIMNENGINAAVKAEQLLYANNQITAGEQLYRTDIEYLVSLAKRCIRGFVFSSDIYSTFNQVRYDRSMCEDIQGARSVWGGLTSRLGHELWRWAMVVDPNDYNKPSLSGCDVVVVDDTGTYTGMTGAKTGDVVPTEDQKPGVAGTKRSSVFRCVQLQNIPAPKSTSEIDMRIHGDGKFSFFGDHHRHYGYLLYATYVALKYAGNSTYAFPNGSRTIAEDIASFFTDEKSVQLFTTNSTASDSGRYALCNKPEPFPLLQMLLDILCPPSQVDVALARSEITGSTPPGGAAATYISADGFTLEIADIARGATAPASTDGVHRAFPPHRHFDPYVGHSWSGGPEIPYGGISQEGSGEITLAYLAAYRLLTEYRAYETRNAKGGPLTRLQSLVGYLYTVDASNTYFPQTTYAIMCLEAKTYEMCRSTHALADAHKNATDQTTKSGPSSNVGGFPVVASKSFNEAFLSTFVSRVENIGVSRDSMYPFEQIAFRDYPAAMILNIGAQLVPISDLTRYINPHTWLPVISGANEHFKYISGGKVVNGVRQNTDKPSFAGAFPVGSSLTSQSDDSPITVTELIDYLIYLSPNATSMFLDPHAPSSLPSRDVQAWARFVATVLSYKVGTSNAATLRQADTAIVFPGPGTYAGGSGNVAPPSPDYTSTRYPNPTTIGSYYLPQTSWFDILVWYRASLAKEGEPTPDSAIPYP